MTTELCLNEPSLPLSRATKQLFVPRNCICPLPKPKVVTAIDGKILLPAKIFSASIPLLIPQHPQTRQTPELQHPTPQPIDPIILSPEIHQSTVQLLYT